MKIVYDRLVILAKFSFTYFLILLLYFLSCCFIKGDDILNTLEKNPLRDRH